MNKKPTYDELELRIKKLENEAAARIDALLSLEETNERFTSLVENASDLIHSVTPAGAFIYVNRAWKETLAYNDDDIKEISLMDIVDPSCRDKCRCIFDSLINGDNLDRNETIFVASDGRRIVVEGRCSTKFVNGKAVALTGIFRDITIRSQSEAAMRASERRYRDLFENAHDLIQIVRPDGQLLYVNKSWRKTFGYSENEIDGLSIFDLISPECQDHCVETFKNVISQEKVNYIETTFTAKDGRKVLIEGNAICKFQNNVPAYTQCIFRDVTEKKKTEVELLKIMKLESIGVLAGGIAHDFNNILTAILGNINLALVDHNLADTTQKLLTDAMKASLRARDLTKQLLTFAKGGEPVKELSSLESVIKDSANFVLSGAKAACCYHIPADLWLVDIDKGQISQVIQNIVLNACQAMPEGGNITVRCENLATVSGHTPLPFLRSGKYVKITLQDSGIGMSDDLVEKIFDPYFTTKHEGSGLGLAITQSIVRKHSGHIMVESTPGNGSLFTILLPASEKAPSLEQHIPEVERASLQARILLMDDDEMVLNMAGAMLTYIGHTIVYASDGKEAIQLYREAQEAGRRFDLVIMDLTVPGGMGGKEAIQKILQIDPTAMGIVSSGYSNDPIMANCTNYGFSAAIVKPYQLQELSKTIRSLLRSH